MHPLLALLAAVLIAIVMQDAFEVMLLPRRVARRVRLTRFYFRASWSVWSAAARRLPQGGRREGFLSVFGALSMVVLFALWSGALILAFGLLDWSLQQPGSYPGSSLPDQIYMSGVTFFTLGYGDVVPRWSATRLAAVLEAGIGLGFIAAIIGYLPVLYQLFSRREAHVILLDGRAGSPPTAGTMLARHAEAGGPASLEALLREWETWGSELLESHLSYPMLVFYRSQHDNQSWLAGLTCVMDTSALILVGVEGMAPLQARMTFTIARQIVVEMARSLAITPSRYSGGDRLPDSEYRRLLAQFEQAGLAWSETPGSQATLAALRATYEPLLDGLASFLLLPLPGWLPAEGAEDHWQRGHRGLIASRLIAQLSGRGEKQAPAGGSLSADLRSRLKS